jgi:hypothetical protein
MEFFDAMVSAGCFSPTDIKIAWVLLYRHMNAKTGRCDPSVPTIAEETLLSDSTVQRALRKFEYSGWFAIGIGSRCNGGHTNAYKPNFEKLVQNTDEIFQNADQLAKGGSTRDTTGGRTGDTLTMEEEPKKDSDTNVSAYGSRPMRERTKEIFDYALEVLQDDDRPEKSKRSAIAHTLKRYGSGMLLEALDELADEDPTVDCLYAYLKAATHEPCRKGDREGVRPVRDWRPNEADYRYATERGIDAETEMRKFWRYNERRQHYGTDAFWSYAWRRWCRIIENRQRQVYEAVRNLKFDWR